MISDEWAEVGGRMKVEKDYWDELFHEEFNLGLLTDPGCKCAIELDSTMYSFV